MGGDDKAGLHCPFCESRVNPKDVVCPSCYRDLKTNCPSCGKIVRIGWRRCPYCGAEIPSPSPGGRLS
ncbi:MAG: double zinc ribbon domain-containing protein [Candidatus Acetothermia bacterium]